MSRNKGQPLRSIDLPIPGQPAGGGGDLTPGGGATLPPILPGLPQVTGLAATAGPVIAAATPQAAILVTWGRPAGVEPTLYLVQWGTAADFSNATTEPASGSQTTATLLGLPLTLYYVRVLASYRGVNGPWSTAVSVTTAGDTTPPGPVTGAAATFVGLGDLVVTWTNPASANLKDVEARIYSGATLRQTVSSATNRLEWTAAQNKVTGSGGITAATSVRVELRARSYTNVLSTMVEVSATKARPVSPPILSATWNGTEGSCFFRWWRTDDAADFFVVIEGIGRYFTNNELLYSYGQNLADHNNVADPTLRFWVYGRDALGQVSLTMSELITTCPTPAPVAITLTGYSATLAIELGAPAANNFHHYRVRMYRDGVLAETLETPSRFVQYEAETSGSWHADVAVVNIFGQTSTVTTASPVVLEFVTLAGLRADLQYRDSLGTDPAILAYYKDDLRTGSGTNYPAVSGGHWWIEAYRDLTEVYQRVTLASAAELYGLIATSADGGATWRHFAAPVVAGKLTEYASFALAAANSVNFPTNGNLDLPARVEATHIRVYSGYAATVYEFYPRRIVQSDDIEAEAIKAIHIGAGTIVADKIAVGALDGKLITGSTVQTAASGARAVMDINGIRTYDSAGNVQIEATTATNGALTWGAGRAEADRNGLRFYDNGTGGIASGLGFAASSGSTIYGSIGGLTGTDNRLTMISRTPTGETDPAAVYVQAIDSDSNETATVETYASGSTSRIRLTADTVEVLGLFVNNSDARLKERVRPAPYGLDAALALRPALYDLIGGQPNQLGFIAQEVEAVVPEIVVTNEAGYKAIAYDRLAVVLIAAIQQLAARVAELEQER